MKKLLKSLPQFASEAQERAFWEEHDSTAYLDWDKAQQVVLPNLKLSIQNNFSTHSAVITCPIKRNNS